MAEEHAPSYYMEEGPELFGEDQWKFLGTDDFGTNVAYDKDFDFGTDEGPANVEDTDSKELGSKGINQTCQEHPPSFYVEPGLEQVGEDQWDFLCTDFDPDLAYDEEFDFGADEGPANVEPTASKDPDSKATDGEGIQEVFGVAREDEGFQDYGSLHVVSEPTNPNMDKGMPAERANAHDNTSQPARDSEPSPAVTAPTVTESKRSSQPVSGPVIATQPFKVNQPKPGANTSSVDLGDDSAVIPLDTPQGTTVPAEQYLGNSTHQNAVSPGKPPSDGRPQDSQLDSGIGSQVDRDQFWKDREEIFSSLNNTGNNNETQFPFDFNNDDWRKYATQMASEDLSKMAETGVQDEQPIPDPLEKEKHVAGKDSTQERGRPVNHEPYSQQNVNNSSETIRPPIYSRQRLAAKTPALHSGHNSASVFRGQPHGPMSARAHQSGNTAGRSDPNNVQGASRAMSLAAKLHAIEEHAAIDDAKSDESDEEDEEDVPDEVAFETYEENDPLIETQADAPKKGWGRVGKRNGHEVWFNPKTSKWRKLQTLCSF